MCCLLYILVLFVSVFYFTSLFYNLLIVLVMCLLLLYCIVYVISLSSFRYYISSIEN